MTASNIISLVVIYLIIIILVLIGLSQTKSKVPCGFWTGVKAPSSDTITNIPLYNRSVGRLWIYYGISLFAASLIPLFVKNKFFNNFFGIVAIIGLITISICYQLILKKYKK